VKSGPVEAIGKVFDDLCGRGEELSGEGVGLLLYQPRPGVGVVVHEQVPQLVCAVETTSSLVLLTGAE